MQFRSDMDVELIDVMGGDMRIVHAARVSTQGEASEAETDPERIPGLINFLMKGRHGSPFEHGIMTFRVSAPIFVWREHHRHRIASYNEESGRYRQLNAVFYTPGPARNLTQIGKAGAYEFVPGTPEQQTLVTDEVRTACAQSYAAYERMLADGVAKEVARVVLPVNTYSTCYVTMNIRALMNFLSLRTKRDGSAFPSFPQREIEMVAEVYEQHFQEHFPLVYAAFQANGRVAP